MNVNNRITVILTLSLLFTSFIVSATSIDIYYPHNNTTTDMYVGNDTGYHSTTNNTLNTNNVSMIILKGQIESSYDILNDQKPLYRSMLMIFLVIVLVFIIVIFARMVKGAY